MNTLDEQRAGGGPPVAGLRPDQAIGDAAVLGSIRPEPAVEPAPRWLSAVVIAIGSLAALSMVVTTLLQAFATTAGPGQVLIRSGLPSVAESVVERERTLSIQGVDRLEVDTGPGSVEIRFGRTDEIGQTGESGQSPAPAPTEGAGPTASSTADPGATDQDTVLLWERYTSRSGPWDLRVEGTTLLLRPTGPSVEEAELVLPERLRSAPLTLRVPSGRFESDGLFGAVDVEADSGQVTLRGGAESLRAEVRSGSFEFRGEAPGGAELEVRSGLLDVELEGPRPERLDVRVRSGSADLTVPPGAYRVETTVGSGSIDSEVRHDPGADARISLSVESGSGRLRQG